MSLQFSNTTTKGGIIQQIERNCGFNDGDISGNTLRLAQFTADVNSALDDALSTIFTAGGTWQFDDANHTDYPIITTNLVAGQRDYTFTEDENANLILDIYKLLVMDESGVYQEVDPVDAQMRNNNKTNVDSLTDGQDTQGIVKRYDMTATGIFLDLNPSYSQTAGIKAYVNREGSYFATTDTTKKPGIDGLCHEYLALVPSYKYARNQSLPSVKRLEKDIFEMEMRLKDRYGRRERDIIRRITPNQENNK